MAISPLYQQLKPVQLALGSIFLDPNNPRFTSAAWVYVQDEDIEKNDIQEAVQRRLVHDFDVEKLKMNMEVNGYLPIDRVIVREFAPGKYVVLEGNRRICAAKMISTISGDGSAVNPSVLESLAEIPCLQYTGTDRNASWVFQGLRHIAGVVEWSAFNKAKLLVEQTVEEGLSLTDAGKRFGLSPHGAGQWVRGYYAFKQARESSDYINEVDERSYPYFQELFSRSSAPVREWLAWDDSQREFKEHLNFDEFISWLYPRDTSADDDQTGATPRGNWEKRRLGRRDDIRLVAYMMTDAPEFFVQFRTGAPVEKAYSMALARQFEEEAKRAADPVADMFTAIDACKQALDNVPYKAIRDAEVKAKLDLSLAGLQKAIDELK